MSASLQEMSNEVPQRGQTLYDSLLFLLQYGQGLVYTLEKSFALESKVKSLMRQRHVAERAKALPILAYNLHVNIGSLEDTSEEMRKLRIMLDKEAFDWWLLLLFMVVWKEPDPEKKGG
ncbi:UNVERIFIED_CONTAM: hypothetical protein FKN15_014224 [Acipenser sinensis]